MLYTASRIFDGHSWRTGFIQTERGYVTSIVADAEGEARNFPGCSIVPAFVDIQVYGAGGKLFSAYLEPDSLRILAQENLKGGTAVCLPTVATNSKEVMYAAIEAVKQYWKEGGEGIAGLHLEGPWISPLKRGAHIEGFVHEPTIEEVEELLSIGHGVIRTITMAPEMCSDQICNRLLDAGIVLSAGHSNIDFVGALDAFDKKGFTTITHLYNAMSALNHRQPGLVGAAFTHPSVFASIIPDDIHVDLAAVKIAHRLMEGRLFAITDAVTETNRGPYPHTLTDGTHYTSGGTLSGSAISMHDAFTMLRGKAGITPESALQMCASIPASVIGLKKFGRIEPGAAAVFLVYDDAWTLKEVISEPGSRSPSACGVHTPGTS